jgi:hypothetical protein
MDEAHSPLLAGRWEVEAVATGANFDAVAYAGEIMVNPTPSDSTHLVQLKWTKHLAPNREAITLGSYSTVDRPVGHG